VKRNLALAAVALLAAGCANDSTAPDSSSRAAYFPGNHANISTYLVDTGPGGIAGAPGVISWTLEAVGQTGCSPQPYCSTTFAFLGGRFVLGNAASIDSVAGWMNTFLPGSIDVHIRADNAGVPGADVHTQNYSVGATPTGWQVFHGFTTTLPAGTYWLTFEPTAGSNYYGSMQDGAANPLSYAFSSDFSGGWLPFTTSIGLRVAGSYGISSTPTDKINNLAR
jgi:hypothetical protein